MLDRSLKGIHAERVEWESKVVESRRAVPASINRYSNEIQLRTHKGEWMPEDDVQVDGECKPLGYNCQSTLTEAAVEGGKEKDIPKPPRHDEVVDTFGTVASNLSELVQVSIVLPKGRDIRC